MLVIENDFTTTNDDSVVRPGVSRVAQANLGAKRSHPKQSGDGITQVSPVLGVRPSRHPLTLQGTIVADPKTLGKRVT